MEAALKRKRSTAPTLHQLEKWLRSIQPKDSVPSQPVEFPGFDAYSPSYDSSNAGGVKRGDAQLERDSSSN